MHGGDFSAIQLYIGKWNNLDLYPSIDVTNARIGTIQGYNVEYPKGNPWNNGEVEIEYHHEPLEVEKPPVPTREELGLALFWAEHDIALTRWARDSPVMYFLHSSTKCWSLRNPIFTISLNRLNQKY